MQKESQLKTVNSVNTVNTFAKVESPWSVDECPDA